MCDLHHSLFAVSDKYPALETTTSSLNTPATSLLSIDWKPWTDSEERCATVWNVVNRALAATGTQRGDKILNQTPVWPGQVNCLMTMGKENKLSLINGTLLLAPTGDFIRIRRLGSCNSVIIACRYQSYVTWTWRHCGHVTWACVETQVTTM